ncbi:MAG: cytochrome-c oxidase, cbb3-type subunit III [Pseudomonadales bacterium]|nr:cytochrome-c oxidase, cbb3-type subunit III [Pseudomonadales bacterium]
MSSGFSWFVIIGTLGSLAVFFIILHFNRSVSRPGQTTGHSYDGIEEYDNPLPAWWYWWFVLTIVFGVGYLIYYPGLGNFPGISGWTQEKQLEEAQKAAEEKYGKIFEQFASVPVEELKDDPDAMKMGRRMFINNCAVCHGAEGKGSFGFPNLTDEEWIWGNSGESIQTTIMNGRTAAMPPWEDILGDQGVTEVVEYVLQLSGREVDAELASRGKSGFMTNCVACHGPEAKGNPMLGAPDLTNDIWLYGGSRLRIEHVIRNGRNGEMPGFDTKLGEDKVHILAAYVKSLGNEE